MITSSQSNDKLIINEGENLEWKKWKKSNEKLGLALGGNN